MGSMPHFRTASIVYVQTRPRPPKNAEAYTCFNPPTGYDTLAPHGDSARLIAHELIADSDGEVTELAKSETGQAILRTFWAFYFYTRFRQKPILFEIPMALRTIANNPEELQNIAQRIVVSLENITDLPPSRLANVLRVDLLTFAHLISTVQPDVPDNILQKLLDSLEEAYTKYYFSPKEKTDGLEALAETSYDTVQEWLKLFTTVTIKPASIEELLQNASDNDLGILYSILIILFSLRSDTTDQHAHNLLKTGDAFDPTLYTYIGKAELLQEIQRYMDNLGTLSSADIRPIRITLGKLKTLLQPGQDKHISNTIGHGNREYSGQNPFQILCSYILSFINSPQDIEKANYENIHALLHNLIFALQVLIAPNKETDSEPITKNPTEDIFRDSLNKYSTLDTPLKETIAQAYPQDEIESMYNLVLLILRDPSVLQHYPTLKNFIENWTNNKGNNNINISSTIRWIIKRKPSKIHNEQQVWKRRQPDVISHDVKFIFYLYGLEYILRRFLERDKQPPTPSI